jgi:hypothetical protein
MLGQIFAAFGGFLGKIAGGGIISTALRFAGRALGNYLSQKSYIALEYYHSGNSIDNIIVSNNSNGRPIPLIFGKMRVESRMIWALNLREVAVKNIEARYFRNSSNIKSLHHNTEYLYYADFALGICEGQVDSFDRVWINGKETDISGYKYRFYKGTEEQEPDPFIEHHQGKEKTPAFRGLCYIIFENFPLLDFGNKIPNFSFEISRKPLNHNALSLEEMIENIVIIPGSGEFVYDTKLQQKIFYSTKNNIEIFREDINCHNTKSIADSSYNLDQLQNSCSNLKWAAPVICWFADSLDASQTNIYPAVEYNESHIKTSEEWNVAGINRDRARLITKDEDGNPNYGGTVNDASLMRYLDELRVRKLKIMLYPMIFLDIASKPWRGHIMSTPDGIRRFFNHANGYKNFILHYANLAKGKIDAFIIGSEFKAMTNVREGGRFPAVEELIDLAHNVKAILGPNVMVTYAADWSEYHHSDGIYNLDPLWACNSIDIIGIDAYFPLTNSSQGNIDILAIKEGWKTGEGFDFYIDGEAHKPLAPEWAWKNIEYWWKNHHFNADGTKTSWVPRHKKIWFTEFGFPSIDKATNQPNIFFDPKCLDGGMPKYSGGFVDFSIQRKAIKATIEFWQNSEFVENIFLWTWDARPYPAWPHGNIWRDSNLWLKGHWINGKLSQNSLANIIIELCMRAGIALEHINVDTIDDNIDNGIILSYQSSIWDVINLLRIGFFFDVRSNYGKQIEFVKRGSYPVIKLDSQNIVKSKKIINIEHITLSESLSEISINFIDSANSYQNNIVRYSAEDISNMPIYYLNFPIAMDDVFARNLAHKIIHLAKYENKIFKFTLLISDLFKINISNIISLQLFDIQYQIRVCDIKYENLLCHITGICIEESLYGNPMLPILNFVEIPKQSQIDLEIFELPISLKNNYRNNIYAASSMAASLYLLMEDSKIKIADLKGESIGVVVDTKLNPYANHYVIDEISEFVIYSTNQLHENQFALIGKEIIYFKKLKQIAEHTYSIASLIRGCYHSSEYIETHLNGEKFILLDSLSTISVQDIPPKTELQFIANKQKKSFVYEAVSAKALQAQNLIITDNIVKFVAVAKYIDYWKVNEPSLEFLVMIYADGLIEEFRTTKEEFSFAAINGVEKISIITIQKGLEFSNPINLNID